MSKKQAIYPGKTRSGIPGVFTSGTLVFSLSEEEYNQFINDPGAFRKYAAGLGFVVDEAQFNKEIDYHVVLSLPNHIMSSIMAWYDFSSEEWDSIPDAPKVKMINRFYRED
jgi:hypothetical protein